MDLEIKTFVFLDLETTGLPHEEYNKTKVTELCCVGVKSRDINSKMFPRVTHKINLCFYPQKMISPESETITGLSNSLLEFEPRFEKEAAAVLVGFLDLLEKPICLVAHNGNYFDYPVLKAEMSKIGSNFSENILCIDSLITFKALYEEDTKKQALTISDVPDEKNIFTEGGDIFEGITAISVKKLTHNFQIFNETTPPKKIKTIECNERVSSVDDMYYKPSIIVEDHGDNVGTAQLKNKMCNPLARKQLNFGKPSFKLVDMYRRLTKKEALVSHKAEVDVLMLTECAVMLGQRFTNWANNNAVKFSTIPAMVPGRKIGT